VIDQALESCRLRCPWNTCSSDCARSAFAIRLHQAIAALLLITLAAFTGCVSRPEESVVTYSAADREYAKPILAAFARRNQPLEVLPQFDVESTKTVGLVTRIESESGRPRCDVFWNNEIMHTLRLEKAGLLQRIRWDVPASWPKHMRSQSDQWMGIAARARILIVNRDRLPQASERPTSVYDLADAKWAGNCGIAAPHFGTTATHFTVLREQLGEQKALEFFRAVKANATVLSGNKQVAQAVSSGQLAFGLTDTDDALLEIDAGLPVEIIYPDQAPGQPGTLQIPNTVAVLKGAPHPVAAALLANFLVSEDTEGRLAMGPSGQFPIRPEHGTPSRAASSTPVRWMDADFEAAAELWPNLSQTLREIY
jgi:iron(III) transport system substrate-binding protein